jgi:acyl transferase domain-containing protein/acyl carrier protein
MAHDHPGNHVAVVGLACRFPGARNADEFWRNLQSGVESISFFDPNELRRSGVPPDVIERPDYVPAKGIVEGLEDFDYGYFGMNPREAALMDPQHRLFLVCAHEALEHAGYDFQARDARVGVYGGSATSTWLLAHILSRPDLLESPGGLQLRLTNGHDFLTTQVSYQLNLRGPSVTVQTACSTALVAVHLACQALLDGECDMALAGAVAVSFPLKSGYVFQEGGIWSPDGHCRPFDEGARGTVEGNGGGVVALKRLEDALAARDTIHAVIRGSAVNNDGSFKVGYTAPSVETQARVVAEALAMAETHAETIGYVEAHGSGTPLGDPIEVRALTQAFRASTQKQRFCYLGSVKSNIGHLDNAAGIASLIKTIQALKHGHIPPTLHFKQPNPQIDLESSPYIVNAQLAEWPRTGSPRRAGVSSLGIGGTNVHVVLEEAPSPPVIESQEQWHVLPISARTAPALEAAVTGVAQYLDQDPAACLADVGYTLGVGRRQLGWRRAVVASTSAEAVAALSAAPNPSPVEVGEREVAFLFPGLGDHVPGVAAGLFRAEPGFRARMDECAEILKPWLGVDLRDLLFPAGAAVTGTGGTAAPDRFRKLLTRKETPLDGFLAQTQIAQPALFAIEYSLAGLLGDWGIRPRAMLGYSLGEYVAACLAGVFSLQDGLRLVATRARMIETLPRGVMLAAPIPAEDVREFLGGRLSLCVSNASPLTVVGGPEDAVAELEAVLSRQGVACQRLPVAHAFHSAMTEPIAGRFAREVATVTLHPPRVPYISNVTGSWVSHGEATDPNFWARHLRETVRFGEGLETLLSLRNVILVEVGPGQLLTTLARQHPAADRSQPALASMRDPGDRLDDERHLRSIVGRLWEAGAKVDWEGHWSRSPRRRVPLPTYPFERTRCWIEPGDSSTLMRRSDQTNEAVRDTADWFYVPVWRPSPLVSEHATRDESHWLVFDDDTGVGAEVVGVLRHHGHRVSTVVAGTTFEHEAGDCFTIRPGAPADYALLLQALRDSPPTRVVHLWSVTAETETASDSWSQDCGFYSLVFLAQAFGEENPAWPVQIDIVSNGIQDVTGQEQIQPHKATVLGPVKVIPQEYPNARCRSIDVETVVNGALETTVQILVRELLSESADQFVAWRGRRRWTRSWSRARLQSPESRPSKLKENGAYLIAGGLEGVGLVMAEHLATTAGGRLALVGPPSFPPRDKWERWLQSHDDDDDVSRNIRRLRALEFAGCDLIVRPVDIADEEATRLVVDEARHRFGTINGVIHAAGAPGAGLIQLKTVQMADSVMAPKLTGVVILERLTRSSDLDFFVVFSSLTALGGGLGQVDTCAAGAFLDAFAHQHADDDGCFTASINWAPFQWDTWQLPVLPGTQGIQAQIQTAIASSGIGQAAAADVFSRILASGLTHTAVCQSDLERVLEQTDAMTAATLLTSIRQARPGERQQRPELPVAYEAPRNATEEAIAAVWAESFGLEGIGVHDGFFELAGNSLLAIQIVTRLRGALNVELSMTALFESPTVAGLAEHIDRVRGSVQETDDLRALLDEIELLSPADAEARLAEIQDHGTAE